MFRGWMANPRFPEEGLESPEENRNHIKRYEGSRALDELFSSCGTNQFSLFFSMALEEGFLSSCCCWISFINIPGLYLCPY